MSKNMKYVNDKEKAIKKNRINQSELINTPGGMGLYHLRYLKFKQSNS